ncbi:MAG: hypothetical protein JWO26_1249 [Rhodospirillales bacterium]|nr:hypothetical protein [Rhodospirillales bacterium]MDB5381617.1 hypothetical protein [Rhodospirillales bacterium]
MTAIPILEIRHVTTYRYRQPVAFGEHRMMLRPREGHDQRIIEAQLDIQPKPVELRWLHDVFGNSVAIANFDGRARELIVNSTVRLDHTPTNALDYPMERNADVYPFSYDVDDMADLARSIERQYPDPDRVLDRWARQFIRADGPTRTRELLTGMTQAIRERFTYIARTERGVQAPLQTLALNSGTCRDFAVLMIEAVRTLGIAARFVSGYIRVPEREARVGDGAKPVATRVGGGHTHAWLRVYLPGAGWVELDPTNGIIGNHDLIRVAVGRDHRTTLPLHGTWTGFPADSLGMTVEVAVTAEAQPSPSPVPPPSPS